MTAGLSHLLKNMRAETTPFDEVIIQSIGQQIDTPERKLWAAVLIQAVDDLKIKLRLKEGEQTKNNKQYLKNQAKAYFKTNRTHIGSFIWICNLFNINPDLARKAILWKPIS